MLISAEFSLLNMQIAVFDVPNWFQLATKEEPDTESSLLIK